MYKTVRKGDASLQYTILPQTDQFATNGFPQTSSATGTTNGKSRSRILKYKICTLLLLIVLLCVATPFLINQDDRNLFAGTILVMGRVGYETTTIKTSTTSPTTTTSTTIKSTTIENASKSDRLSEEEEDEEEEDEEDEEEEIIEKNEYQVPRVTTTRPRTTTLTMLTSTNGLSKSKDFEDRTMSIDSFRVDEIDPVDTVSPEEAVGNVADETRIPTDSVTNARQTGFYSTQQSSYSSSTPSSKFFSSSIEPSEMTKMASGAARKAKMPRVTLKLRENETIPQMYMKAGIASYKKGNITTSVLAHGLSLEGLIFKTPEGTIKPWPQKWFFSDPSSDFQWKGPNQMPMMMYIVLAGLACLGSLSIVLMFYVQRKASKRQRHDVEEPETESHEEDKSTLLGADSNETEDKE